jgi:predicted ArsR family transcriptional regulator
VSSGGYIHLYALEHGLMPLVVLMTEQKRQFLKALFAMEQKLERGALPEELTTKMGVSRQAVQKSLQWLRERELVTRRRARSDAGREAWRYSVSAKGREWV